MISSSSNEFAVNLLSLFLDNCDPLWQNQALVGNPRTALQAKKGKIGSKGPN